ncbi:MAG: hypothetical protein WBB67_09590 [bacterium]
MSKSRICAYIDILGFSDIVQKEISGALVLLTDFHETINMKLSDMIIHKHHYDKHEKDPNLRESFKRIIIDTFEYFIPFSDSVFIIANNADMFVYQLSNLLYGSFMLGGHIYDNHYSKDKDDLLQANNSKRKWYPLLFKGGIAFGDCVPMKIKQIAGSKTVEIYNVLGTAVVEAVGLEKSIKGPRLFCTAKFYNCISNDDSRRIIVSSEINNIYEVLWPMPHIIEKGVNGYKQLLEISINLWKHFNHKEYGFHYFKYVELIIKSILEAYRNDPEEMKRAKQSIQEVFGKKSINIRKVAYLVEKY